MPAPLSLEISASSTATIVRVAGEIDLDTKDDLEDALAQLGVTPRYLDVDLGEVTFIDSSGLQMLMRMHRVCQASGGVLTIRRPSPSVRSLFDVAGVNATLTIVST